MSGKKRIKCRQVLFNGAARNFQQQPGVLKQRIRSLEHENGRRGEAAFLLPLQYSVELLLRQRTHMYGFFFKSQNMVWSQKISASEVGTDNQA